MSRSTRKTPICGIAHHSDKEYKKRIHRKERVKVRELLSKKDYDSLNVLHNPYNSWDSNKDGKKCFIRWKKKDIEYYKKLMRK